MESPTTGGYFFHLHVIPQKKQKNWPVQPVCSVTPNQATSLLGKSQEAKQRGVWYHKPNCSLQLDSVLFVWKESLWQIGGKIKTGNWAKKVRGNGKAENCVNDTSLSVCSHVSPSRLLAFILPASRQQHQCSFCALFPFYPPCCPWACWWLL